MKDRQKEKVWFDFTPKADGSYKIVAHTWTSESTTVLSSQEMADVNLRYLTMKQLAKESLLNIEK